MASKGIVDLELLQQIAMVQWASTGDSELASKLAYLKLAGNIWERLSGQSELDAVRSETILRISKYVKDNPKASKEQMTKEIGKEIEAFAMKVKNL